MNPSLKIPVCNSTAYSDTCAQNFSSQADNLMKDTAKTEVCQNDGYKDTFIAQSECYSVKNN